VLSGFIGESGQALGRPVGVDVLCDGAILVADDVANVIWRLVPSVGCLDNVGFECDSQ
jgi:Glucose/sorbosone dehydrogenases